ncbi:MAG: glutamate synthase large subunit [Polyangiaceae bacterium]
MIHEARPPEGRPGLYDPQFEHDACGLGFVARLGGKPRHDVVEQGLEILRRLAHRGAAGSDPETGDGAGILIQIPHAFFERQLAHHDIEIPLAGDYGVAQIFLSRDRDRRAAQRAICEEAVRALNQKVIAWRDVPVDPSALGPVGRASMPHISQLFIGRVAPVHAFERSLFTIRKRAGKRVRDAFPNHAEFYIASLSSKTIVYKGLALPERLDAFYLDLKGDELKSKIAMVHSRFSTNTFPTWERAHPFRRIAHNGEINTLRGNRGWMAAREAMLESKTFAEHLPDFLPIIRPDGSDSASLDNVVDFLVAGGRSLPHVMMMLVPEAWSSHAAAQDELKRGFYEYHASLVEPWDGPAALPFTDGSLIGGTLDRNGLRPGRYLVTKSGLVVLASEVGVIDIPAEDILEKGRLAPGKMFLVDVDKGVIISDEAIKREIASKNPYGVWVAKNKVDLDDLPDVKAIHSLSKKNLDQLARAVGVTRETLRVVIAPMAEKGEEPTGSMGNDTPLAVLSDEPQSLFRYFKQQFSQVTNPPIDPIREELVMSLVSCVGGEGNLLAETPKQARLLELPHPILTNDELAKLKRNTLADFRTAIVSTQFQIDDLPGKALERAIARICDEAAKGIDDGCSIVVLSDRGISETNAAVPALLAIAAVQHDLIRRKKRMRAGLVVETAEALEVADIALLVGYGAGAVNPYLALELAADLAHTKEIAVDASTATKNYVKALKKGLLKVLSKMGISTVSSYQGAQIFEAFGLGEELIEKYFPGTPSPVGGVGLDAIARDVLALHAHGFGETANAPLASGGVYAWRATGERHLWDPTTIATLQKAVRLNDAPSYAEYTRSINEQKNRPVTLRGLWDFVSDKSPISVDEVEPAVEIVKRFATGAMSFGSISKEAHENLAIAMNRIGGKSNSGEGGEDSARFERDEKGDLRRSAIKQVASARFGVTAHYLVNADELEIKVAQGAKPGEGGQLPGHKVDGMIARVRHATPGVTLISPPPHHDIYSIEDLAQLIFDLRCVNPKARITVKLVAESGVGTVAAGVVKAGADVVHIAGHDGGTGASPLSSVHRAGGPWEVGLAEAQQVLVMNGLRDRAKIRVDGQLKTGRDVVFGLLLGADEFGFATAPLVASGCLMMRKCHLNTCPVGIATQDPELRARFTGTPEHVINYFFFVAEEARKILASLGFKSFKEAAGHVEVIQVRSDSLQDADASWGHKKARTLDFSRVLARPKLRSSHAIALPPAFRVGEAEAELLEAARLSLKYGESTSAKISITNADRAFGAALAGEIATKRGAAGLKDGAISVELTGSAGQSFGAFATRGMLLVLEGEANDYVGKGLSGGVIAIRPSPRAKFRADENQIVGNTVLYGATSGSAYFAGRAGERFAVRNSGANAVVEGVGDHGCEYMTAGVVVVLGSTGRNFAAGMSGGIAYVFDEDGAFRSRCNGALVEIENVGAEDEVLRALVEAHLAHTRSEKASRILSMRDNTRALFVRVVPTEYRNALALAAATALSETKTKSSQSHG